jgi:excisionase family DNA binding protein
VGALFKNVSRTKSKFHGEFQFFMEEKTDGLMTVSEVAAFLRVPASWIYERTRRTGPGRLPHVKLGKYLRFDANQIRDWLRQQTGE